MNAAAGQVKLGKAGQKWFQFDRNLLQIVVVTQRELNERRKRRTQRGRQRSQSRTVIERQLLHFEKTGESLFGQILSMFEKTRKKTNKLGEVKNGSKWKYTNFIKKKKLNWTPGEQSTNWRGGGKVVNSKNGKQQCLHYKRNKWTN